MKAVRPIQARPHLAGSTARAARFIKTVIAMRVNGSWDAGMDGEPITMPMVASIKANGNGIAKTARAN